MTHSVKIKRGLDLPIAGRPESRVDILPKPERVGVVMADYPGLVPRLEVAEGDSVALGQPLFHDKRDPEVKYVAYVSGKVSEIRRGARRKLLSVVLSNDDRYTASTLVARKNTAEMLQRSGLWTAFRRRPFGGVPRSGERPDALFITATDTRPLGRDVSLLLERRNHYLAPAFALLSQLVGEKPIYVVCSERTYPLFERYGRGKLQVVRFTGPYPSGLVGTHMHFLHPARVQAPVWALDVQDLVALGYYLEEGTYLRNHTIALGGEGVVRPRHVEAHVGADLFVLLNGNVRKDKRYRTIRGSVLWGDDLSEDHAFLGGQQTQISVVPLGENERHILGWIIPRPSQYGGPLRVQLPSLSGRQSYSMTTNLGGSYRAFIPLGQLEDINSLRLLPSALMRYLLVGDIERIQALGGLELVEEDIAHFAFADVGKNDFCGALRNALTRLEREFDAT